MPGPRITIGESDLFGTPAPPYAILTEYGGNQNDVSRGIAAQSGVSLASALKAGAKFKAKQIAEGLAGDIGHAGNDGMLEAKG